jgi:hypothetical protein
MLAPTGEENKWVCGFFAQVREYLHDKTIHYGGKHIGGGRDVERERLRAADVNLE